MRKSNPDHFRVELQNSLENTMALNGGQYLMYSFIYYVLSKPEKNLVVFHFSKTNILTTKVHKMIPEYNSHFANNDIQPHLAHSCLCLVSLYLLSFFLVTNVSQWIQRKKRTYIHALIHLNITFTLQSRFDFFPLLR